MAYMLLSKENDAFGCYRVYLNDSELNTSNIRQEDYDIQTISEDQMNQICEGTLQPVKTNNVLTWETTPVEELGQVVNELSDINPGAYKYMDHLDGIKKAYNDFLESNPNHSRYNEVKAAYDALPTYSELLPLLPLNKPLWKSLKENGYPLTISPFRLP